MLNIFSQDFFGHKKWYVWSFEPLLGTFFSYCQTRFKVRVDGNWPLTKEDYDDGMGFFQQSETAYSDVQKICQKHNSIFDSYLGCWDLLT